MAYNASHNLYLSSSLFCSEIVSDNTSQLQCLVHRVLLTVFLSTCSIFIPQGLLDLFLLLGILFSQIHCLLSTHLHQVFLKYHLLRAIFPDYPIKIPTHSPYIYAPVTPLNPFPVLFFFIAFIFF